MAEEVVKSVCPTHGEHDHLVCIPCYNEQALRVEKEAHKLQALNTTTALRQWVIAELAKQNGGSGAAHS